MRFLFPLIFVLLLVASGCTAENSPSANSARETRWTMLNVTPLEGQADCHLLELPNGIRVLIDAAEAWDATGEALRQLVERGVTSLDLVVISHFHHDHYNHLLELAAHGIHIGRVAVNIPERSVADKEKPWGCDYEHVQETLHALYLRKIPWFIPTIGERLIATTDADGVEVTLDAVCLYDGINTPVGTTDVNDTSIIVRLSHGPTRALFTGDLNQKLGAYLADGPFDISADILKVPHHGTEGVPPDSFFARVGAKAVLVPSPQALWASPRSMRVRNFYADRKISAHVSGFHGVVQVTMTAGGFTIANEREFPAVTSH